MVTKGLGETAGGSHQNSCTLVLLCSGLLYLIMGDAREWHFFLVHDKLMSATWTVRIWKNSIVEDGRIFCLSVWLDREQSPRWVAKGLMPIWAQFRQESRGPQNTNQFLVFLFPFPFSLTFKNVSKEPLSTREAWGYLVCWLLRLFHLQTWYTKASYTFLFWDHQIFSGMENNVYPALLIWDRRVISSALCVIMPGTRSS
jgi:hypothetical protein